MANPYLIEGPALISFSGGRSSAMMLHQIIQAQGGTLPPELVVAFANTGKEREETLRFVHECGSRWGVHVHWLEFVTDLKRVGPAGRFEEVNYNSASRNGEPLDRLIARKRAIFSTIRGRWCTEYCKVGVLHDFMAARGYERGQYLEVIGLRADEHDRVYELPRRPKSADRRFAFPLVAAEVRKADVNRFWEQSAFDLGIRRGTGNCDHCPFVSDKARIARARLDPEGLDWWAERETRSSFGYMSVADMQRHIAETPLLPLDDLEADADEAECGTWCPGEAA